MIRLPVDKTGAASDWLFFFCIIPAARRRGYWRE